MKIIGYCKKCGSKLIEIRNMGAFDDFSMKCWHCKVRVEIFELRFKKIEDEQALDKNNRLLYSRFED